MWNKGDKRKTCENNGETTKAVAAAIAACLSFRGLLKARQEAEKTKIQLEADKDKQEPGDEADKDKQELKDEQEEQKGRQKH